MAGIILGVVGRQRSGKTLIAYKICKYISKTYHVPVYSNIMSPKDGFIWTNSLENFPLDLSPKVLFIDEVYNGTDAQDFKKLKEISIFLNTLGKQNCLFIYTTIGAEMVYNRLRNQTTVGISVNSDSNFIYYRWVNFAKSSLSEFKVPKNEALFNDVYYDTSFIPLDFDWSMDSWRDKLKKFYLANYHLDVSKFI